LNLVNKQHKVWVPIKGVALTRDKGKSYEALPNHYHVPNRAIGFTRLA
jgi:hypothetical protein